MHRVGTPGCFRLPGVAANDLETLKTMVETTEKGSIVTQTSADAKVVAALQAHAGEVNELARDGMAAVMRGMRARMMAATR